MVNNMGEGRGGSKWVEGNCGYTEEGLLFIIGVAGGVG